MAAIPEDVSSEERLRFTLNGREIEALSHETILQVAQRVGIDIPYL